MKKIVMITPGIGMKFGGGRVRTVEMLSTLLSMKGYKVLILSKFPLMENISISYKNIEVKNYGFYLNKKLDYLVELYNQFKLYKLILCNIDADVIHLHSPLYGFAFPPKYRVLSCKGWAKSIEKIKLLKDLKIVLHFHGSFYNVQDIHVNINYLKEIINTPCDHIIVLSERDKILLKKMLKESNVDVPVSSIYNPVPPSFFRIGLKTIDEDSLRHVLYAGGSYIAKGFKIALSLSRTLKSGKITMVGPHLRKIEWFDMPSIMSRHGIVLMPTYREGLPLLLLESMAAGRVVITSSVGGITEVINNGINGFLCPPGDIECFKEKLIYIMNNLEYARKVAKNAYRTALEKFSIRKFISSIMKIYTN